MRKSVFLFAVLSGAVLVAAAPASAALLTFNSPDATQNAATRTAWLAAIGIASPDHLVDFESGFVDTQNIDSVLALFPLGLVINDTSAANAAIIRSGTGIINGSNPVGVFALTQNEQPYLEFDFSSNPVDYFGFLDIDQAGTTGIVTFVGGATAAIGFETTAASGNSAEFFGIFRNDMPAIVRVQLDASGDGLWAVDNLEYGGAAVPEPGTLALLGLGMAGLGLKKRRSQR
jgi:PEP-CTERM motif